MYEVAVREPQRRWPGFRWVRITPRPIGLARATALADAQEHPSVVAVWQTAQTVHRNALWTPSATDNTQGGAR